MKKLLLALCVLTTGFSVNAQAKKDSISKVGVNQNTMHNIPVINDSTGLLQAIDLQELINLMQDYPARYANPISQWLQNRYQLRAQQYMKKPHEIKF